MRALQRLERALDEATVRSINSARAALIVSDDRAIGIRSARGHRIVSRRNRHRLVSRRLRVCVGRRYPPARRSHARGDVRRRDGVLPRPSSRGARGRSARRRRWRCSPRCRRPSDSSSPLARRVALEAGLNGFDFAPPATRRRTRKSSAYDVGGVPLFDVRVSPARPGRSAARISEGIRVRAGLAFHHRARVFRDRRVARDDHALPSSGRARGGARVHRARAAQPVLEHHPAVRSRRCTSRRAAVRSPPTPARCDDERDCVLLGILAVFRRQAHRALATGRRWPRCCSSPGLGPFLLRELARGIHSSAVGVNRSCG